MLPILAYVLVRIDFVGIAILLILLSKWRMFAVRPRYWVANLIGNGVDIMVAVSLVIFMATTTVVWWQLFWTVLSAGWLLSGLAAIGLLVTRRASMKSAPAGLHLGDPGVQVLDADGNGQLDLMVVRDGLAGVFPMRFGGGWDERAFRSFAVAPSFGAVSARNRCAPPYTVCTGWRSGDSPG